MIELEIFWLCFRTSLVSFAGVYGALPEFSRLFVVERGWLTADQLMESYILGQVVPGPNMVLAALLGFRIAGVTGACAAFTGTYAAPISMMFGVARIYGRLRHSTSIRRIELALRPLVVGLMAGTAAAIVRDQVSQRGVFVTATVAGAALFVHHRRWLSPVALLLGSGVLFWLLSTILFAYRAAAQL